MVFLFLEKEFARQAVSFATSQEMHGDQAIPHEALSVRSFRLEVVSDSTTFGDSTDVVTLHGVFCAPALAQQLRIYWRTMGTGISSRFAEDTWKNIRSIREITTSTRGWSDPNYTILADRIAGLLNRAPIPSPERKPVTRDDVYLYPTGMSAIYHTQKMLNRWKGAGETVVFGFPYELTPKLLDFCGPPVQFYPFGSAEELDQLEQYLESKKLSNERVQAIWCECPSNPLLRTPNFQRLKQLSRAHKVPIVVDETIGSFANVDLLNVADVLVSSLTKSFSGYADVMAGSTVINPSSPLYSELKVLLDTSYTNHIYKRDTAKLEANSRNYLERTTQLNSTAQYLVSALTKFKEDHSDILTGVYYPEVCWSKENYAAVQRPPTKEFAPGFGGLFTIEFADLPTAITFFNNLHGIYKGPSLGASVTLAQPYVQTVFHKEKEFAARCGLNETIIRFSVGLEDKNALLNAILLALSVATEAHRKNGTLSG